MSEEQTVSISDFQRLAAAQMERALKGDPKACEWVGRHKPEVGTAPVASTLARFLTELDAKEPWALDHALRELPDGMARKLLLELQSRSCADAVAGLTLEELRSISRGNEAEWKKLATLLRKCFRGEAVRADLNELRHVIGCLWDWQGDGDSLWRELPCTSSIPGVDAEEARKADEILARLEVLGDIMPEQGA